MELRADGARGVRILRQRDAGRLEPPPVSLDDLLERPFFADPLRRHDIAPITDGAAAIVLAADDRARELRENPAWITGIEHRIESPALGVRDLTESPSTQVAAKAATGGKTKNIEVAELHAPFTHQHLIIAEAINLPGATKINPPGRAGGQPHVRRRLGTHRFCRTTHLERVGAAGAGTCHQRARAATESGRGDGRKDLMAGAGAQLAAVLGTGQTKYVAKRQDVSMNGMVREAIDRALEDSGSTFDDIDAVVVGKAPDFFEGVMMPSCSWPTRWAPAASR